MRDQRGSLYERAFTFYSASASPNIRFQKPFTIGKKSSIFFAMHPKLSGKEQTQNVSVKQ
jgi:hypothetical protein